MEVGHEGISYEMPLKRGGNDLSGSLGAVLETDALPAKQADDVSLIVLCPSLSCTIFDEPRLSKALAL